MALLSSVTSGDRTHWICHNFMPDSGSRGDTQTPNTATIRVYNVAPSTAQRLENKPKSDLPE
jgi:hypothetical protein